MGFTKVRSYEKEVLNRLFDLVKKDDRISVRFMGVAGRGLDQHVLYYLSIGNVFDSKLKNVCISAGVHGEEPAGVYSLFNFLENNLDDFIDDYRFLIFPCINPFGFEYRHRFNQEGLDINREFKIGSFCDEANAVMRVLRRRARQFVCTVDLHETDPDWTSEGCKPEDNPKEFYMWEVCPDKNLRVGDKVIKMIYGLFPVCKWDTIYQDINSGGVIWYPEGSRNEVYADKTTLEGYLADNYTPQSFTIETPCGWHMDKRVFAHLSALRSILHLKR